MEKEQVLMEVLLHSQKNNIDMRLKIVFITLGFVMFSTSCFSQILTRLYDVEGGYFDKVTKRRVLPKYNVELDVENKLYYNSDLKFEPSGDFNYCIYELFNDRFIVISALNQRSKNSSIIYALPKNKIIVIDMKNWDAQYQIDLGSKLIYDIFCDDDDDEKVIIVKAVDKIHNYELKGNSFQD